jgi:hypothetical protein
MPFIKQHRFLIVLILLFIILRLPSLFEPIWYGDEGIYLTLGQAVRKGWLLYNQIHDNKPPTLYYFAAIAQTVSGFRLLLAVWMIPTIYVFYLLSQKFLSLRLAQLATLFFLVVTSVPFFEGNIANSEIFMLLPTILAVYLIYSLNSIHKSYFIYLISGFLLGFAFTIKVPVAVEFGFLFVWIILTSRRFDYREIFIFSAAFSLPILLYSLFFFIKGAFNNFIFAALLQNFGYLSSWVTGSHSGSATGSGLITRALILAVFWVFIYILFYRKTISRPIAFVSFWFSAAIFGALLSTRPYPHYLIQVLPSLTLLLFLVFDKHLKNFCRRYLVILLAFSVFIFFHFHFYTYPVFSYYRNFYSHLTTLNSADYRRFFGSEVNNTYAIAAYIKANTSPTEKIFVWGDNPFVYVLSDRLPVGRFTVAYHIVDFNQYQTVSDQLRVDFPNYIIYYPQSSRPFSQLDDFISRFYFPINTFGSTVIYRRIDHHYAAI